MESVYISKEETESLLRKLIEDIEDMKLKNEALHVLSEMRDVYDKGKTYHELSSKFRDDYIKNYEMYKKSKSEFYKKVATQQYKMYKEYSDVSSRYFEQYYFLMDNMMKTFTVVEESTRMNLLSKMNEIVKLDPVKDWAKYQRAMDELNKLHTTYITTSEETHTDLESKMEEEFESLTEEKVEREAIESREKPGEKLKKKVEKKREKKVSPKI